MRLRPVCMVAKLLNLVAAITATRKMVAHASNSMNETTLKSRSGAHSSSTARTTLSTMPLRAGYTVFATKGLDRERQASKEAPY